MDSIDKRILGAIQQDVSGSVAEVAERVGISQSPCWKRIKKLEEQGYIKRRVAILDANALGLDLVGYIQIRAERHNDAWLKKFAAGVRKLPEIVECHRMTGEVDYLLKVVLANMAEYDAFYKKLIKIAELTDVSVSFSMESIKETNELPLSHVK